MEFVRSILRRQFAVKSVVATRNVDWLTSRLRTQALDFNEHFDFKARVLFSLFRDTPIFGFADDYVFMIRGLLDLYEASLDEQWLEWAVQLQNKLDELLWDKEGIGYFMVTPGDPSILVKMKEG